MRRRSLLGFFIAAATAGCSDLAPTGSTDPPGVGAGRSTKNEGSQESGQSTSTYAGVQFDNASIAFGPESIARIERITDQTKVHNAIEEYDRFLEGYSLDLVLSETAQADADTFDQTQKERYYEQMRSVEGKVRKRLNDEWPQLRYYTVVNGESVFDHNSEQFQYETLVDDRITAHGLTEDEVQTVVKGFGYRIESEPAKPESVELVFSADGPPHSDDTRSSENSSSDRYDICDGSEFSTVAGPFLTPRGHWSLFVTLSPAARQRFTEIPVNWTVNTRQERLYTLINGELLGNGEGFALGSEIRTAISKGEWDGRLSLRSQTGLLELSTRLTGSMVAKPDQNQ